MKRNIVLYSFRQRIEDGQNGSIFENPLHLNTNTLLSTVPALGKRTMDSILLTDEVPSEPAEDFTGWVFVHRCVGYSEGCLNETPVLKANEPGHFAACWRSKK